MRVHKRSWIRRLAGRVWLAAALASTPWPAVAQLAPTGGHYAARASDTGFAGAVSSQGGYSTAVPLDLPGARGGLPVPVQIVAGGRTVGAAGLGWDVPLSFIRRDTTTAHRRPVGNPDAVPTAREQLSLTLDGQRTDLVPDDSNTVWVPRLNGPQLEVRRQPDGSWVLYDGRGLTYVFTTLASPALADANLWLLQEVTGPGGSQVHLEYDIGAPPLPSGLASTQGTGLSIDLTQVSYNPSPTTAGCYKNQVVLHYDPAPPPPPAGTAAAPALSMSVLGSTVLARVHTLASVDVSSQATCAGGYVPLRTYQLAYQPDVDTGQPQLRSVTMIGQQGTPERKVTLPVATYAYGSATGNGQTLTYRRKQRVPLPSGVDTRAISRSFSDASAIPPTAAEYSQSKGTATWQSLLDFDGDGRPDLTYRSNGQLLAIGNIPGFNVQGNGGPVAFLGIVQLTGAPGSPLTGALEMRSAENARTPLPGGYVLNTDMVWRQAIDVNGDGRVDLVDAKEEAGSWVVYLNTPSSPSAPSIVKWERRTISIAPLVARLRAGGHAVSASYLPLSQRKTGSTRLDFRTCWKWVSGAQGFHWVKDAGGYASGACIGPPGALFSVGSEESFVEWELRDMNGDGYPDLVFDSTPVGFTTTDPNPDQACGVNGCGGDPHVPGQFAGSFLTQSTGFLGSDRLMVMLDVAGMQLDQNTSAFSAPVNISVDSRPQCAVEHWQGADQDCGFADVNGDGLPERVDRFSAALNTGNLDGGFFRPDVRIDLPNLLSRQSDPQYQVCAPTSTPGFPPPDRTYASSTQSALRDMNGDGLADYVSADGAGNWSVSFGTGTRFTAAKAVNVLSAGFALSQETENCGGTSSDTTRGLFDVDGDGQPEVVLLDPNGPSLDIYQLDAETEQPNVGPVASRPMAGRLVQIDNGYGAVTTIGYRSAKEDGARHLVPFPETVVAAVGTADSLGSALESPTLFAYGFAELQFDPTYDAFVFPGYRRTVRLRITTDQVIPPPTDGLASLTDTYGLAPFAASLDADGRFRRYRTSGLIRDVTTLGGNVGRDPWALLGVDIATDPRRIAGTHYDWGVKRLPPANPPTPALLCFDMEFPYDFRASAQDEVLHLVPDQCLEHGFVFEQAVDSWRGQPGAAPPSTGNVHTRTEVVAESVDAYGRIGTVKQLNDVNRADDDATVFTSYATPTGKDARRLDAVLAVNIAKGLSGSPTVFHEHWEYDTPPGHDPSPGTVGAGFPTAHVVSRLDAETGAGIPDEANRDLRVFEATYDGAGNPATATTKRDDGATRTMATTYDAFGLAPVAVTIQAKNAGGIALPALTTTIARDDLTLAALSTTDPNGTARGNTFDGFGRVVLSTVAPPGGGAGALSSTSYPGFAVGETGGPRIVRTVFTDPVAPASVATATGRTRTVFLDRLGRARRAEVALGADYANKVLVVGNRTYDRLGRVQFESDPLESGGASDNYGTTYHYNTDGTPACFIRGKGPQPLKMGFVTATDESAERYPTCFGRVFDRGREIVSIEDAAGLLAGSPQAGVLSNTVYSAIGRVVERSTEATLDANPTLEDATFDYDALGHLTGMTRYPDPSAGLIHGVTTTWHYDSLGQVLELDEPDGAPQLRSYDSWGEPTGTQWCDPTLALASPCTDRRTVVRYDALGRVTHREDQTDHKVDAETVDDLTYDLPATFVNRNQPTHVLGRLASATWPTARVSLSYDAFGRVNGKGFDNRHGNTYIEKHAYHGDGSPAELHLLLPDNKLQDERVDYTYDSAGRMRSVRYGDGTTGQSLFSAPGGSDLDVFGRVRRADYGPATFTASYADGGRRLLKDVAVTSPAPFATSREIAFQPIPGTNASVAPFDPLGRELARREFVDGVARPPVVSAYDALGRLAKSLLIDDVFGLTAVRQFTYDPLGNLTRQDDLSAHLSTPPTTASGTVQLDYRCADRPATDQDRICRIGYGAAAAAAASNVQYDGAGNIVAMPTRGGGTRTLSYFANGQVKKIAEGSQTASFGYDAFGAAQVLTTSGSAHPERHFGALITERDETVAGGAVQSTIDRAIPGPAGLIATRHGAAGPWVFAFGEPRGNRFFTDQTGQFVQDVEYQPYGEVKSAGGALPGTQLYSRGQWNGGEALEALGVSQLGARLYDPVLGRFLSRDPLLFPWGSASTNPYAFAMDDPVNSSDPSGLCQPEEPLCNLFGGGGFGGGGYSSGGGGSPGGGGRGNADGPKGRPIRGTDLTPPFVRDLQRDLRPYEEMIRVGESVREGAQVVGGVALDVAPIVGTIRAWNRGDYVGAAIGLASDALIFAKVGGVILRGVLASAEVDAELARVSAAGPGARDVEAVLGHGGTDGVIEGNATLWEGTTTGGQVRNAARAAALDANGAQAEVNILTNAHLGVTEGGLEITESRGGRSFFVEDAVTQGILQEEFPNVTVNLFDAVNPTEYDRFLQALTRARAGEAGVYAVGGVCHSVELIRP